MFRYKLGYRKFLITTSIIVCTLLSTTYVYSQSDTTVYSDQLAQSSSLDEIVNPTEAEAGLGGWLGGKVGGYVVNSTYQYLCSQGQIDSEGNCNPNREFWAGSLVNDVVYNNVTNSIYGYSTDELIKKSDPNNPVILDEIAFYSAPLPSVEGKLTRVRGDGVQFLAKGYSAVYDEPPIPTNFALYMNDQFRDTIFGTPAYAEGFPGGDLFENMVLQIWKITRNIALSLFGLLLAIAAFMVMFRHKISPQATVSIYNVLPMIPIVLGLIVFSYPLISIAISTIPILNGFASDLASSTYELVLYPSGVPERAALFSTWSTVGLLALPVLLLSAIGGGPFMLIVLIAFIVYIVIMYIIALYNAIKVYVSLLISVVVSPFVILTALIPGRQKIISNLGRSVAADVLTIPIITFIVTLAVGLLAYMPDPGYVDDVWGGNLFSQSSALFLLLILKIIVAGILLFKSKDVPRYLRNLLGVQSLWSVEEKRR